MSSHISIAVSASTLAKLKELAGWAGVSVEQALEKAVKEQHEARFWQEVDAGYAALRADPVAWAHLEAERKLWDNTLMDGLDPNERWNEDGGATS